MIMKHKKMEYKKFTKKDIEGKIAMPKKPISFCEIGGYCGATKFLTCPSRGSNGCKRMELHG